MKTELDKNICKACKQEIIQLPLTIEQKYYLYGAMKSDLKLFAANKIQSDFGLNKVEAQSILEHLNSPFGKCCNCEFDELKEENIECPNCGKLNYNLSDPYGSKEFGSHPDWCGTFCSHLEWSLSFEELDIEEIKGFWCDGIEIFNPEEAIANREIKTKSWLGKGGSDVFEMKITFGAKFISTLKTGGNMIDCIPKRNAKEWIDIDCDESKIVVRID